MMVVVTTNAARRDVQGHCEPGFEAVADLLADNLRAGREISTSIGVYSAGRPVAQIWGGWPIRGEASRGASKP
jgi:hypothetical protein